METCKLTRHGCKYAPFNPNTDECFTCVEREEACAILCPYCKEQSNQLDPLEQRVDELSEEYDAVLKTHGDTLEEHLNSILELKKELGTLKAKLNAIFGKTAEHTGSNFCGNCFHHDFGYEFPCCRLTGEACDPDDASCTMYQDSYIDTDSSYPLNKISGKPDREECNHCDRPDCSGCNNYPF